MKQRVKLEASLAQAPETSMCIHAILVTVTWRVHIFFTFINICNKSVFDVLLTPTTLR
jgi:hypothetical protein